MGAKIAALRKDRKLTQEQLAEKVGITVQYLGTIERRKANTTLNRLDKIADILSCSSNDLIFSTTPFGHYGCKHVCKCISRAWATLHKLYLKKIGQFRSYSGFQQKINNYLNFIF